MPLSNSALSALIYSNLAASGFQYSPGTDGQADWLKYFCDAVAAAVVTHIQSNSMVVTTSGAPDGEHVGMVL